MKRLSLMLITVLLVVCMVCGHLFVLPSLAAGKIKLYLDLKSEANLFFDTYDIDIFVDEQEVGSVSNGARFTKLIDVSTGQHELMFCKASNQSVFATKNINITEDTTFQCDIAHGGSINLKNMKTEKGIEGSSIEVPDVTEQVLSDAMKQLKDLGFVNLRGEPNGNIWDENNWYVLSQGISAGTKIDKNTQITLTCRKTDDILSENFEGLNIVDAEKMAKEMGFSLSFSSETSDKELSDTIKTMSDSDKKDWTVSSAKAVYNQGKTAKITVLYVGNVKVPDVMGMTLYEAHNALRAAELSNITDESDDGNSIWNTSNWIVTSQSVAAGSEIKATDEIILTGHNKNSTSSGSGKTASNSGSTASTASTTGTSNNNSVQDKKKVESSESGSSKDVYSQVSTQSGLKKHGAEYHSSNSREEARNGDSGVFAYRTRGGQYYIYYIIDFDEGYTYRFLEGNGDNTCEKVKIASGTLNDVVIIEPNFDGIICPNGLYFKYVGMPDHMILEDEDGFTTDFYPTDLEEALEIKETKKIYEY